MTELALAPLVSLAPSPASGVASQQAATASPARDNAPQRNTNPFQEALALELGLGPEPSSLPGAGPAAKAGSSLKYDEDSAQPANAPPGLSLDAASPSSLMFPPFLHPLVTATPLSPAFAQEGAGRAGLAGDSGSLSFAESPGATRSNARSAIGFLAADSAARGKFPLSPENEPRPAIGFDASMLEEHKAAPALSVPSHGADAAALGPLTQATGPAPDARVGDRGWDQGLGDKLLWMAGHKQQVAELHLNPPELGPLKITLTLDHDQASAQFVSAHAPVREAIEAALPRLREMLSDSGITLGNTSVSTDAFREQAQPQHEPRAHPVLPATAEAGPGATTRGQRRLHVSQGLVDTFA